MLNKLYNLVFGFSEFEKTKFEVRFDIILEIIDKIEIRRIEDFELLEKIIYKINELLRIRSSNLNKAIKDSSNKLKKKDVINILNKLNNIKYSFLKEAFKILSEKSTLDNEKNFNRDIRFIENSLNDHINNDTKDNYKDCYDSSILNYSDSLLITNQDNFKILLVKGRIPYLKVIFNKFVDFIILKEIVNIFFNLYKPQGTNIIINGLEVWIVPRILNDNLFKLPSIELNLNDIFKKITENIISSNKSDLNSINNKKEINTYNSEFKEISENNVDINKFEEKINRNKRFLDSKKIKNSESYGDNYLENITKKQDIISNKKKEIELEEIIENQFRGRDEVFIDRDKNKNSKIKIEKDEEKIEVELEPEKKSLLKEGIEIDKEDEKAIFSKNNINKNFIFYEDEKIIAYLNNNSKIMGEILVRNKRNLNLNNLTEGDLSYLVLFSKIFSSILFEELGLDGTNLLWDFNNNYIRIIPRKNNDGLKNLVLVGTKESDSFLEQVKNKLLLGMNYNSEKHMGTKLDELETSNKDKNKIKDDKTGEDIKEKAKLILESLKRIP